MRCSKCGFEFTEGIFCPECGTKNEIDEKAKRIAEENERKRVEQLATEKAKKKIESEAAEIQARVEKELREKAFEDAKKNVTIDEKKVKEEAEKSVHEQAVLKEKEAMEEKIAAEQKKQEQEAEKERIREEKARKKEDARGIVTLILGIVSWVGILTVIIPFICGIISIINGIKVLKNHSKHKGCAIAGIVLSVLVYVFMIWSCLQPTSEKTSNEAVVIEETAETDKEEAKLTENEKEKEISEAVEEETEETEKTSLFGYPEQEKELADAGYDMTKIPSRECFLYSYAEYKTITDYTDIKDMDTAEEEALNYVTDDSLDNYVVLETIVYNYPSDNLANYISGYLVPLVGDEWQDVCDKATMEYFGYSVYSEQNEDTSSNITIAYIESLEIESIGSVYDMGNRTKEELYAIAESIYQNDSVSYSNFTKDAMRDSNNVGNTYRLDMFVSVSDSGKYIIRGLSNDKDMIISYIDLSILKDISVFSSDNIIVNGIYLGLTEKNNPVFLATSVTVY